MSLAAQLAVLASKSQATKASKKPRVGQAIADDSSSRARIAGKADEASFLFDRRVAREVDTESVHAIALSGLQELGTEDARFLPFEETLFQRSASPWKRFDRAQCSPKTVAKLNKVIDGFLRLLSPHFMATAAHQVVEFLVRQFAVHVHNREALLRCVAPYHETELFARMVQLLALPEHKWDFLYGKSRDVVIPLSRTRLVRQCLTDRSVLQFVCDVASQCDRFLVRSAKGSRGGGGGGVRGTHGVVFTFFGLTLVDLIAEAKKFDDDLLRVVLSALLDGLKPHNADYRMASQLALLQLFSKVQLSHSVMTKVFAKLVECMSPSASAAAAPPQHLSESLVCLACAFNFQKNVSSPPSDGGSSGLPFLSSLPREVVAQLVAVPNLCEELAMAAEKFDVRRFVDAFCRLVCDAVCRPSGKQAEAAKLQRSSLNALKDVARVLPVSSDLVRSLVKSLLDLATKLGAKESSSGAGGDDKKSATSSDSEADESSDDDSSDESGSDDDESGRAAAATTKPLAPSALVAEVSTVLRMFYERYANDVDFVVDRKLEQSLANGGDRKRGGKSDALLQFLSAAFPSHGHELLLESFAGDASQENGGASEAPKLAKHHLASLALSLRHRSAYVRLAAVGRLTHLVAGRLPGASDALPKVVSDCGPALVDLVKPEENSKVLTAVLEFPLLTSLVDEHILVDKFVGLASCPAKKLGAKSEKSPRRLALEILFTKVLPRCSPENRRDAFEDRSSTLLLQWLTVSRDAPVADVRAALTVGAHSLCPLFRRLAKLLRKSTNSKRKSVDARLEQAFSGEKFDALTAEQAEGLILESLVGSLDSAEALAFVRSVLEQFASRSAGTHVSHDVALLLLRVLTELFLSASGASNVDSLKPKAAQKLLTFEEVSTLVSTYHQLWNAHCLTAPEELTDDSPPTKQRRVFDVVQSLGVAVLGALRSLSLESGEVDTLCESLFRLAAPSPPECSEPLLGALFGASSDLLHSRMFGFLHRFWVSSSTAEVDVVLCVRSLQLACVLVSACKKQGYTDFQFILSSLMVPLTHTEELVRASAIHCLRAIADAAASADTPKSKGKKSARGKKSSSSGGVHPEQAAFVDKALFSEAVSASATYLNYILEAFLSDAAEFVSSAAHLASFVARAGNEPTLTWILGNVQHRVQALNAMDLQQQQELDMHVSLLAPLLLGLSQVADSVEADSVCLGALRMFTAFVESKTLGEFPSECRFLVERITVDTLSPKAADSATHFATLLRILALSTSGGASAVVAHAAVERVDGALFQCLKFEQKRALYQSLCSLYATGADRDMKLVVQKALRGLTIEAALVNSLLKSGDASTDAGLLAILEVLQHQAPAIVSYQELCAPLTDLLSGLVTKGSGDDAAAAVSSDEYSKRLVLSCLTAVVRACAEISREGVEDAEIGDDSSEIAQSIARSLSLAPVVQCIESSLADGSDEKGHARAADSHERAQTRNYALRFLSQAVPLVVASLDREDAAKVVMTPLREVFNHLCHPSILGDTDPYSFTTVQDAIESLLPLLLRVAPEHESRPSDAYVVDIFLDALVHVPDTKRWLLFEVLLRAMGFRATFHVFMKALVTKALAPRGGETPDFPLSRPEASAFAFEVFVRMDFGLQKGAITTLLENFEDTVASTSPECALAFAEFISRVVASWRAKHFSKRASDGGRVIDDSRQLSVKMFLAAFHAAHSCNSGESTAELPVEKSGKRSSKKRKKSREVAIPEQAPAKSHGDVMWGALREMMLLLTPEVFVKGFCALFAAKGRALRNAALRELAQRVATFADAHKTLGDANAVRRLKNKEERRRRTGNSKKGGAGGKKRKRADADDAEGGGAGELLAAAVRADGRLSASQLDSFAALVSACVELLQRESKAASKILCLNALGAMALTLASYRYLHACFLKCFEPVSVCMDASAAPVAKSAFECISSFVAKLGVDFIAQMPLVMEKAVTRLEASLDSPQGADSASLQRSLMSTLRTIVTSVPNFVNADHAEGVMRLVLDPRLLAADAGHEAFSRELLSSMAAHVTIRHLVQPTVATLSALLDVGLSPGLSLDRSVSGLFAFFKRVVAHFDKDAVRAELPRLVRFFLRAFDLRVAHAERFADLNAVENDVTSAFVTLAIKLDGDQLRSAFGKCVIWTGVDTSVASAMTAVKATRKKKSDMSSSSAMEDDSDSESESDSDSSEEEDGSASDAELSSSSSSGSKKKKRKLDSDNSGSGVSGVSEDEQRKDDTNVKRSGVFFHVVGALLDQVGALFLPYIADIVGVCVTLLSKSIEVDAAALRESRKKKRKGVSRRQLLLEDNPLTASRCASLALAVDRVLAALTRVCKIDLAEKCEFVNRPRFEKLVEPLVSQIVLAHAMRSEKAYRTFVEDHLVQCFCALAAVTPGEELLQVLNRSIFFHTRSAHADVRLCTLYVVHELFASEAGERLIAFLPQTVSYLSELLEDSNVAVEQLTRKVIKQIEKVTGESLSEYMK